MEVDQDSMMFYSSYIRSLFDVVLQIWHAFGCYHRRAVILDVANEVYMIEGDLSHSGGGFFHFIHIRVRVTQVIGYMYRVPSSWNRPEMSRVNRWPIRGWKF